MALLYLGAAWLVMQVVDVIEDPLRLPDWVGGTYAAVASTEKHDGRTYLNYFPAELIRKTLTKVEAGGFAYMGTADLDVIRIGGSRDAAQRHFEALLAPRYRSKSVAYRIFDRSRFFLGKEFAYRRDDPDREAKAREHLASGDWKLK